MEKICRDKAQAMTQYLCYTIRAIPIRAVARSFRDGALPSRRRRSKHVHKRTFQYQYTCRFSIVQQLLPISRYVSSQKGPERKSDAAKTYKNVFNMLVYTTMSNKVNFKIIILASVTDHLLLFLFLWRRQNPLHNTWDSLHQSFTDLL